MPKDDVMCAAPGSGLEQLTLGRSITSAQLAEEVATAIEQDSLFEYLENQAAVNVDNVITLKFMNGQTFRMTIEEVR